MNSGPLPALGGESDSPHAPGLRVLVVEDDPDLAAWLAGWLGRQGYQARVAPDGPTALRAADVEPPDVVLLDIGLPGAMDGFQVAERLREGLAPAMRKAPLLIAVTARGDSSTKRKYAKGTPRAVVPSARKRSATSTGPAAVSMT